MLDHVSRIILVANGECAGLGSFELGREGDFVLCLNGGSTKALAFGLRPHVIIGDLDSADDAEELCHLPGVEVVRYPREKDKTDMELGLEYLNGAFAGSRATLEIWVFGALGDRLDQTLANLFVLQKFAGKGMRFRLVGSSVEAWVFAGPGLLSLKGVVGNVVSIIPLSPRVEDISLEGLKYEANGINICFGDTTGVSNELSSTAAEVSVGSGVVLVTVEKGKR